MSKTVKSNRQGSIVSVYPFHCQANLLLKCCLLIMSGAILNLHTIGSCMSVARGLIMLNPDKIFRELIDIWPCYSTFQIANDKGADQTARMRRLICAFVVRNQEKSGFLVPMPIWCWSPGFLASAWDVTCMQTVWNKIRPFHKESSCSKLLATDASTIHHPPDDTIDEISLDL